MNPEIPNQLRNKFVGLDVYLARHCNLRCRGCTRYSNIAKPKFYDATQLISDLLTMVSKGINLTRITLTGGEPLLHPDFITIIKDIRLRMNNVVIDLFTNGKLFMEMKDELLPALKKYNVEVLFSRYDTDIEYDRMSEVCKQNEIFCKSISEVVTGKDSVIRKFTCNRISHPSNKSRHPVWKYNYCSDTCPCLWDSKIFLCGKCALIDSLNEYMHTSFRQTEKDYIKVSDLESTEQYLCYISKPIPFCKYCFNQPGKNIIWSTKKPQLSDFICVEKEGNLPNG